MPRRKAGQPSTVIRDWQHADTIARQACLDTALLARLEAELNHDLADIRARYEEGIGSLRSALDGYRKSLEQFAAAHQADFGSARHRDLVHARIGFRLCPPAVKTLNRRWTFGSVLEVVQAAGRKLADWVRTKQELDKEAILADYAAGNVSDADLAQVGLRVTQDEQFVLDLNLDSVADH